MKKSLIFGAALMLVGAFAFQSCANESKPGVPTEAAIDNGTELADVIVSHAKDGVLALPKNVVELNVSADLDLSQVEIQNESPLILNVAGGVKITLGKNLNNVSINGNAEAPATIEATEAVEISGTEEAPIGIANANFNVAKGITIENAIIDASAVDGALVTMAETPVIEKNAKEAYIIDAITLKNVAIAGVTGSIYWDHKVKYGVSAFTIDNCVIALNTNTKNINNESVIACEAGGFKDFTIKNSTVYNTSEKGAKYFLRYNNNGRLDNLGYDKSTETQTWTYNNNTFYKTIDNSDGQWGNGPNGQSYMSYDVQNNIWVDTSKDIIRRLCNGRYNTELLVFANNTYWRDGAALNESSYDKSGTALATDPAFEDAANADFTPTGADQVSKKTGDPRWFAAE